jgi:hypothetical protein
MIDSASRRPSWVLAISLEQATAEEANKFQQYHFYFIHSQANP